MEYASEESHLDYVLIQATPKTNSSRFEIGLTHQKTICFRLWVLIQKLNMEMMETKTIEFHWNGAHCFSRRIILARAWTKHDGLSKVRNSFWFWQENQKLICVGCRRDSQSRNKNRSRKFAPFSSQRQLAHFWTDIRFENVPACRSGVYLVFQKQLKT